MEIYLKFTAGLLLMVHAFQLASLQDSTDSPGRVINQDWLRDLTRNKTGRQNAVVAEEESEDDQDPGTSAMESSNEFGGIASGYMVMEGTEDLNSSSSETVGNTTSDDLNVVPTTLPHALPNDETKQPELSYATDSPTTQPTNSSQANETEAEEESHNSATTTTATATTTTTTATTAMTATTTTTTQTSTAHSISPNSTSSPDLSNRTDLQSTTSAAESNATQGSTTEPEGDGGSSNSTASQSTTSMAPQEKETSITPSSTTAFPPETTETSPVPPTSDAPITPEQANKTDKDGASGSSGDRGVSSDSHRSGSNAWGAVLGTAVAVTCVGLVAYIILKKKHQKAFSHRKLVEEFPSDPVLRLDNSEPLDLNFGRAAYFNPGLQGDNIQMSNFPGQYRT